MITYKYIDGKNCYVFAKDGIYWSLTPNQLLEMHKLTGDLVLDAVQKFPKKAIKSAEKA